MSRDSQYQNLPAVGPGVEHAYGPRVHIHSYAYPMALLTRLCHPETTQPQTNQLVARLFDYLLARVASTDLQIRDMDLPTRMADLHPNEGRYRGAVLDTSQKVVVVDIARAGMLPAQRFFDGFCHLLRPEAVREDHIFMNRRTNEAGEVVGVDLSGSKIGGPVNDRVVIMPDPMGATGGSLVRAIDLYREREEGPPAHFVAVHLIVTPEYIKRVTEAVPNVTIHTIRLDRGMSPPDVLATKPGERWDEESGLNANQYIVPGAGGVGELINNAEF